MCETSGLGCCLYLSVDSNVAGARLDCAHLGVTCETAGVNNTYAGLRTRGFWNLDPLPPRPQRVSTIRDSQQTQLQISTPTQQTTQQPTQPQSEPQAATAAPTSTQSSSKSQPKSRRQNQMTAPTLSRVTVRELASQMAEQVKNVAAISTQMEALKAQTAEQAKDIETMTRKLAKQEAEGATLHNSKIEQERRQTEHRNEMQTERELFRTEMETERELFRKEMETERMRLHQGVDLHREEVTSFRKERELLREEIASVRETFDGLRLLEFPEFEARMGDKMETKHLAYREHVASHLTQQVHQRIDNHLDREIPSLIRQELELMKLRKCDDSQSDEEREARPRKRQRRSDSA